MNNRRLTVLISIILLVFGILVVFVFDINCIFKNIIGIPCPGCGLTRGFRSLFSVHLLKAEMYNFLTIPIFLFLLMIFGLIIVDIVTKKNRTELMLNKIASHYIILIAIVCINWIINIIRGV